MRERPSDRPRQLALELPVSARFGREDFLVSPSNEQAYGLIERWPDWPDTIVRLEGPRGSGKSHLAAIFAAASHAPAVEAAALGAARVPHLVSNGALVIEDADRGPRDEAALFHLLNLARERRAFVLLTASRPIEGWGLATPDLVSRLRLAPCVALSPPDDSLLKAVLVKLFVDRQLVVDASVVDFLALRLERSLSAASEAVAMLDREALSRGRRITRAMAGDIIDRLCAAEAETGLGSDEV